MLSPAQPPEPQAAHIGKAIRQILEWIARPRTRTKTLNLRLFGREILHIERDSGKT